MVSDVLCVRPGCGHPQRFHTTGDCVALVRAYSEPAPTTRWADNTVTLIRCQCTGFRIPAGGEPRQ